MRTIFLAGVVIANFAAFADEIEWDTGSRRFADIDCDEISDEIIIGYVDSGFQVKVTPGSNSSPSMLNFGLGNATEQTGLCGSTVQIRLYQTDSDSLKEEFGEVFEGYQAKPGCFDINLTGGECDSINVFWNHNTKGLNWWRR